MSTYIQDSIDIVTDTIAYFDFEDDSIHLIRSYILPTVPYENTTDTTIGAQLQWRLDSLDVYVGDIQPTGHDLSENAFLIHQYFSLPPHKLVQGSFHIKSIQNSFVENSIYLIVKKQVYVDSCLFVFIKSIENNPKY